MTGAFRVLIEGLEEGGELLVKRAGGAAAAAGKGGARTADDAGQAVNGAANAGKAGETAANAGKAAENAAAKSKKSKLKDTLSKHKGKIATGAAVAGVGALVLANGDDDSPKDDALVAAANSLGGITPTASSTPFAGFSDNGGEIEVDPDVMWAFITALRSHADHLESAAKAMPDRVEAVHRRLSQDADGSRTQDGKPSPAAEDFLAALDAAEKRYAAVTSDMVTQLRGDANRLEKIVSTHMETQHEAAKATENIDADVAQ